MLEEIELDVEEEEARPPAVLRDPGAPTAIEIDTHNVTHLPYRAWCPSCVAGKAANRAHRKMENYDVNGVPEVVFDYGFMGAEGEEDTIAIQVAKDRRSRAVFAHVVPRKGVTHTHGAEELIKDLEKLGYDEVILKSDGEPALRAVQEEVRRRRGRTTILENSPPGESQSNGVAERAVRAVAEHVRVLRKGLEERMKMTLNSHHPVVAWLVGHVGDLITKHQVGDDGRTAYERIKCKAFRRDLVEFGEKVHFRNVKKNGRENKMEGRWGEGFFLGLRWRTGEAIIGTETGLEKTATIKRVGAHRRWDPKGLAKVKGWPWCRGPDEGEPAVNLRVRWLDDDEVGRTAAAKEDPTRIYRLRLKREDFIKYGFTEGCIGCEAIIKSTEQRGHTEACRARMLRAMGATEEGQRVIEQQAEKEVAKIARKVEEEHSAADEERRKKAKKEENQGASSSSSSGLKRSSPDEEDQEQDKKARSEHGAQGD